MNDRNNLRRHDNRSLDENRGHYGESGLSSDCFDDDAYADDDSREETAIRLEIIRALMDAGFEPGMVDDRLFQEYLKRSLTARERDGSRIARRGSHSRP